MNYEKMRWHEINMAVTRITHNCQGWAVSESNMSFYHCGIEGNGWEEVEVVDYRKPENAWSIIVDNAISITSVGDLTWNADSLISIEESASDYNHFECISACSSQDKDPLRAAMICFLKMKESENG